MRRSGGGFLDANVIKLEGSGGGGEVRGIMSVASGKGSGKVRIGRSLTAARERFLKDRLNALNRVIQLFKN